MSRDPTSKASAPSTLATTSPLGPPPVNSSTPSEIGRDVGSPLSVSRKNSPKRARDLRSLYVRQIANWSVYDDIRHVSVGSSSNSSAEARKPSQTPGAGSANISITRVLGCSDLQSATSDEIEPCVLVEWSHVRANGNIVEWVAEKSATAMVGGREAIQQYHQNMNSVQRRTGPETRAKSSEPIALETEVVQSQGSSSPRSQALNQASRDGIISVDNATDAGGAAYEAVRDAMRIRRRQQQQNSSGTPKNKGARPPA